MACPSRRNPPEEAGETGRGSNADRPAPGSSSAEQDLPRGTAESRAPRRGLAGRTCCERRAGSRALARSCPPGPCAAPPMPGLPRTLGETYTSVPVFVRMYASHPQHRTVSELTCVQREIAARDACAPQTQTRIRGPLPCLFTPCKCMVLFSLSASPARLLQPHWQACKVRARKWGRLHSTIYLVSHRPINLLSGSTLLCVTCQPPLHKPPI